MRNSYSTQVHFLVLNFKKIFEKAPNTCECIGTNSPHSARLLSWRKNYSFSQQYFAFFLGSTIFLVFWLHHFLCLTWNFKNKETEKILVVVNKNCWLDPWKLFPVTVLEEIGKSYLLTLFPTQTLKKTLVCSRRELHSGELNDNFAQLGMTVSLQWQINCYMNKLKNTWNM